jgi:hypothetical protein
VAKDRRSPYLPGQRSRAWRKVKIRPEQELVVGGWTRGIGPASELAALHVGVYQDGHLHYAGKVGSGFTRTGRAELLAVLRPLVTDEPPFSRPLARRLAAGSTWVRPEVVIRAEFAGWVGDGMVRQASYKGIDGGKDPRSVVREAPGLTMSERQRRTATSNTRWTQEDVGGLGRMATSHLGMRIAPFASSSLAIVVANAGVTTLLGEVRPQLGAADRGEPLARLDPRPRRFSGGVSGHE